ncbi:unnamed protein product, partial [Adineta steineri]
GPGFGPGKV